MDALSLICSSAKTTAPVDSNDIELLKHFLKFNMACENASFRHQTVTNFKKLFLRLFAHASQLEKLIDESTKLQTKLYGEFLMWFVKFWFDCLYPSAPYCQTSISLELLSLITCIFAENKQSSIFNYFNILPKVQDRFTHTFIKCFEDTYDPNRNLVYNIFTKFPLFCSQLTGDEILDIFNNALTRMISPQPDSSSVAAYYVNYLVLMLTNEDSQNLFTSFERNEQLNRTSTSTYYFIESDEVMLAPGLFLLDILVVLLQQQLNVMKSSLITASQNAPLYAVLYSIRMLFQLQKWNARHSTILKFSDRFSNCLNDLIEFCLQIVSLVSQYVSSDAPEGHLCDANLTEMFQLLNLSEISPSSIEVQAQIARMLLVCCWRSMKEVSLLLGIIVSKFSTSCGINILPKCVIMKIWNMFCDILLRSKHAGAYELASLGFIKLSSVLWLSEDTELQVVPSKAVVSLVQDLLSEEEYDNAQVTRRSAGIPFFLQALCSTEPPIKANQSFKYLMQSLTSLCKNKLTSHDINKLVISLNILRSFYKDAKLCEDVFPFISDGIIIAIEGFSSPIWSIRNTCTLLFSALMQRIFGVKKFKMTGREFFSRFPNLYSFLLEQAKVMSNLTGAGNKSLALHPSIFPVLLLLSHLYPSTVECSDSLMSLQAFIPYIVR